MVDDIRILATVDSDACHVDSNTIRTDNNAMILEGIFGLIISVSAGGDKTGGDPAGMVLKGLLQGNKLIQKEKNKEIDDGVHEEIHQLTKDIILETGGNK